MSSKLWVRLIAVMTTSVGWGREDQVLHIPFGAERMTDKGCL
jgi:hypothetical protein